MTDLAIIIVSHNTRSDLDRCLRSLHEHPPAVPHTVIVVDNASTDGSTNLVRQWPDVQLVESATNVGFARATNSGIRSTQSTFLLLLNSDTSVPSGTIDTLLEYLGAHRDTAAVGPRIVDGIGQAELSFGKMLGPWTELRRKVLVRLAERGFTPARRWIDRVTRQPRTVDWISGACLMVRRADAEAAGLLDERYFIYCEDVDFCAALRARGRVVRFIPSAQITHYRGRSVATAPRAAENAYRRSQIAFYEKHHPAWAMWLKAYLWLRGRLPETKLPSSRADKS